MQRITIAFALSFMAVLPLVAQQGDAAQQHAGPATGISRKALHAELNGVKRAVTTAVKEVETDAEKRSAKHESQTLGAVANDQQETRGAIVDATNETRTLTKTSMARIQISIVIFALLILVGLGAIFLHLKRNGAGATTKTILETLESSTVLMEPPLNPTMEKVRDSAKRNGNFVRARFQHSDFDEIYEAVIEVRGADQATLVKYIGFDMTVRWSERFTVIKSKLHARYLESQAVVS